MRSVTIVGVGRVGGALFSALHEAGYDMKRLVSNDIETAGAFGKRFKNDLVVTDLDGLTAAETELLFITTQDSNIRTVADRIASLGRVPPDYYAFHCSGALSSTELAGLSEAGYQTASIHPLVSISDSNNGQSVFKNVYFSVEGDPSAVSTASEIVGNIGGRVFEIPTGSKLLYHAAAVVACGHLVALFEISMRMLSHCGLDEDTSRKVMLPLVESTLANLRTKTPSEALTGPFARGDVEIIAGHLRELGLVADDNMDAVYRILGLASVELAEKQGVSGSKISEMLKIILLDKSNSK